MAIPKTFTAGERLFAVDLNDNFVASDAQGVRVFADAAARTTVIPAPAEGMLTYNEDTAQLEVYDGTAFVLAAPAPPAGIGSNVVQTVKTDTFTTASSTFVDITGFEVVITPSSATAKVLVIASVNISALNNSHAFVQLMRTSTALLIGDAAGNRIRSSANIYGGYSGVGDAPTGQNQSVSNGFVFLDSPATTSATTYKFQMLSGVMNRAGADTNSALFGRTASAITVIEVAA